MTASHSALLVAIVIGSASALASPTNAQAAALPRPLTLAEKRIVAGSNDFAFDLFRAGNLTQHRANVFISPLSASMALGMAASGANGQTYDEMLSALRLGGTTRDDVGEGYKSLIPLLRSLDPKTTFTIANSIWYERSFPFRESFLNEAKRDFGAEVRGLDFRNQSAIETINSWVRTQTNGKIASAIDEIPDSVVMYLMNAIYFKGAWKDTFDKGATRDAPFHAADGKTAMVRMMQLRRLTVRYAATADWQAIDLPYGNSVFSMTVILPDSGADIDAFAESFDRTKWLSVANALRGSDLHVELPRFKIEWQHELKADLQDLGMRLAFEQADFTRMSPLGQKLAITRVMQKTLVEVDEQGTEAAAVSTLGLEPSSYPYSFRVDRPFLVLIRERLTGTILFFGKIATLPAQ